MITYEAVFNTTKNDGVFGISLVKDPAMEGLFVALSKQESIQLKEVDKEQRILMGLVLEPNKPVYRNQNGEEFNIVFKEDTVKELAHNFFKAGFQKNSTIEHEDAIKGVTFVESWIVENPTIDKSTNFGFSYPKGSWVASMKVDSDEIWNEYVKTGKVLGFSVDAMIDLKEVNLKTEINMSTKIVEAIENGFSNFMASFEKKDKPEEVVKLMSVKSGEVDIMFDGEMLEVGGAVFVMGEDEEKIGLPVGEYPLEDGSVLVVSEEGVVGEVKSAEAPKEEPAELENDDKQAQEIASAIKSVLIKYKEQADIELKESNDVLSKEIKELQTMVMELADQPAARKIVSAPMQPTNAKERILQSLRN